MFTFYYRWKFLVVQSELHRYNSGKSASANCSPTLRKSASRTQGVGGAISWQPNWLKQNRVGQLGMSETRTEFSSQRKKRGAPSSEFFSSANKVEFSGVEFSVKVKKKIRASDARLATWTSAKGYMFTTSSASFAPQCLSLRNKVIHTPYANQN